MSWEKLPPHTHPYIGCLNCGGGEMRRDKMKRIVATMRTRIYGGFGGWFITKDGKAIYAPPYDGDWADYPTLMTFENMARNDPDHDWRAECDLSLRSATYQRQGRNEWVLVASGEGFA